MKRVAAARAVRPERGRSRLLGTAATQAADGVLEGGCDDSGASLPVVRPRHAAGSPWRARRERPPHPQVRSECLRPACMGYGRDEPEG
eukprot:scaffold764_cov408-Prasinococcus_capsulatus_cf.AAC.8